MINLIDYEAYWRDMLVRIPEIKDVFFVTAETDIQNDIQDIKAAQQPFLMVVLPSATGKGSYDNAEEDNQGIIYLYKKEDNSRQSFGIQKELQPVFEQIKSLMREDSRTCSIMRGLDFGSLHSDPERKMFSVLSGWSLSFSFESE